jgi:hypothetical protein
MDHILPQGLEGGEATNDCRQAISLPMLRHL